MSANSSGFAAFGAPVGEIAVCILPGISRNEVRAILMNVDDLSRSERRRNKIEVETARYARSAGNGQPALMKTG